MAAKLTTDEKREQTQALYADAKSAKSRISVFERTASSKVRSLDTLIAKGSKKLSDALTGFTAKLDKDSKTFHTKAQEELNTVTTVRRDTKKQYDKFNRTYNSAMNKTNGVETKHAKIVQLADTAAEKVKQITRDETRSTKATTTIADLLKDSRSKAKTMGEVHDEALTISDEIRNTYALTLDTGMAGTFIERREALRKRTRTWEIAYLGSIGLIAASFLIALLVNPPENFIEAVTERLVFVTPFVVVAFVLSKQYGHERKLFEEYAFKAAAAQSLRGYTILLNSQFKNVPDAPQHILKFTIDAMTSIYDREPLTQTPTILHLIFGNDLARFEAKLEDKIEKATKEAVKSATEQPI